MKNARMVALELLHETMQKGAYPNLIFEEKTRGLEERDKKFVTLLLTDTLANLIHIDYILEKFIGGKSVKPIIRNILRMGVEQLKFLNISPAAVINESVNLTKEVKKPMLSGFVNGVLRNVQRHDKIDYPMEGTLEYYSIVYSKPLWLLQQWEKDYSFQKAVAFAQPRVIPTCVRQNLEKHSDFDVEDWMVKNGYSFEKLFEGTYTLPHSYGLHQSDPFKQGIISIQGLGSQLVCHALKPQGKILDACAAPGGKTLLLAELTGGGDITACDLYGHRLKLIEAQLRRGGYSARLLEWDMTAQKAEFIDSFDCVLIDAPCTGLGMIHSKPDILLNKRAEDLTQLSGVQTRILQTCSSYVKSGGTLVYSTCTINKIENDEVVKKFLKQNPDFVLDGFTLPDGRQSDGMLQLTPDIEEGFFMARMVRR